MSQSVEKYDHSYGEEVLVVATVVTSPVVRHHFWFLLHYA